jgi:type I restriction enzyme S subunit
LKQFCTVFPSNVDKKSVEGEMPVKLCNYTDVYYNDSICAEMEFMDATASEEQATKFALRAGDVIITKDSEAADDIAIAAYVPETLPGVVCGYHLSMIRPRSGTNGAYVKRVFDSTYAKSLFAVRANGLTRVGLSQYAVDNVELPLPPSHEQVAIATFLDRETAKIDALITEQQRLIELLQEKRQAVISHAVTKGLNPNAPMKDSGLEWLGEVPEHWTVMPLRLAARIESGHTPSRSREDYWIEEECIFPWFTLGDVWQIRDEKTEYVYQTQEKVSQIGLNNSAARLLPVNTVILSRTASVGFSAILGVPMATTQDFVNWICGPSLTAEFLLYLFRGMKKEFERLKYGSTHNTIYMPDIFQFRVALPSRDEQAKIVSYLRESIHKLDASVDDLLKSQELLRERRSALISAAVTGQIDVRCLVDAKGAKS